MKRKLLGLTVALLLAVGAFVFWYGGSREFTGFAAETLASEIRTALGIEVSVAALAVESPTTIGANGIVLYDKSGNVLLKADRVEVSVRPLAFIAGASALESIGTVKLSAPEFYLRQKADGAWNFEDLTNGEKDAASNDFSGVVVIDGAHLMLEQNGKALAADELDGRLDFSVRDAVAFMLSCKRKDGSLETSGNWSAQHKAVSVKAKNFHIADYLEYLPENLPIEVKEGTLSSLDVTLLKENDEWQIDGETLVMQLAVEVEGTLLDKIDGLILFDENQLRVFSRGQIDGQPVVLRGTATLDKDEPFLDMTVSSKGFDFHKVLPDFPLQGSVAFQATVGGSLKNPLIDGQVTIPAAQLYDYALRNIQARLKLEDDLLHVDTLTGEAFNGNFALSGDVRLRDEAYRLHLKTEGISLDSFAAFTDGAEGRADVDMAVNGHGFDRFMSAGLYGTLVVRDGSYASIGFKNLEASLFKPQDSMNIALDYLNVDLGQGRVSASGTVAQDQILVSVYGHGIELQQFAGLAPEVDFKGRADFAAEVTGPIGNPSVKARFAAVDGSALYQPYRLAEGDLTMDLSRVTLKNVRLTDGRAEHFVDGSIGLANQALDLKVISVQARAENLMRLLLPEEELTGNVDNTVVLRGTLADLEAEGEISFSEGSYKKILLAGAKGKYSRKNGRTEIRDFTVNSPNLQVKFSGVMEPDETLNFDIAAEEIDVGKLYLKLPYPVSGQAKFFGKLRGTVNAPEFYGQLAAPEVIFNGRPLSGIEGQVSYGADILCLDSLRFGQGEGTFSFSAEVKLETQQFNGSLDVQKGDVAAILDVFNIQQDWLSGALDGQIRLEGSAEHPKVRLKGNLLHGALREYPLDTVDLDVALDDTLVSVHRFYAKQNEGVLAMQGKVDLEGDVQLEIAGQSIDAALLTHLARYDLDAQGILNFGAQVSGRAKDPKANVSLEIAGGGVGSATFDSLYGLFTLESGIIHAEQVMLTKGEYKATAYGEVPLAALTKTGPVSAGEQMDLKISLDQADLTILPFLSKDIEWAMGKTSGILDLTGTLEHPLVNGRIAVDNGAVKLKPLAKPIEALTLDMQFRGTQIDLNTFEGTMGNGNYRMFGQSRLTGNGLSEYAFTLELDHLDVVNPYYTGPLTGKLALLDEKGVPKLKGNLDFTNVTVDIPSLPESEGALPRIRLDIDLNIGPKVRLYNALLYDILLEGHVHLGGSTAHPQSSGEVEAIRGTVSYLKTPFQVRQATALFNQVGSFLPSVSAEADTRLSRARVYLAVSGPADQLQLKVWSSPEMSEQEILSLLTLRSQYYEKGGDSGIGQEELNALVDLGLQMSFLSEVENMIRSSIGVDEFSIVRDTLAIDNGAGGKLDKEVYNLEIGKYVTDKLMLKYTTGLDYSAYRIGVRYDFNSNISLTSDWDQEDEMRIGIEARFKF